MPKISEVLSYKCTSFESVQEATKNLDIAYLCPMKVVDHGVEKDIPNYRGIYNATKGKFCAAVVPHYNVILHKDYIDSTAQILDRLNIKYTMVIKQAGNKMFADITFSDMNIKLKKLNEEFTSGIRLSNSYNKTIGLQIAPLYTRLACTNGMILTRAEKVLSVKHHSKLIKELEGFIEQRVNNIINENNDLKTMVAASIADSIEWQAVCKILEKSFDQLVHRTEILKRLNIDVITKIDKKTKKKHISYVWSDENKKHDTFTRWEIYNAVTNYLTHGEQMTPHIENLFQKRAEHILRTPLAKLPQATS